MSVKEAVLPFDRFPEADSLLGPEMRSTGEVMGIDATFGLAFAKSQLAAGDNLAETGTVFFSVADRDKRAGLEAARRFVEAGFDRGHLGDGGIPEGAVCRWPLWWPRWRRWSPRSWRDPSPGGAPGPGSAPGTSAGAGGTDGGLVSAGAVDAVELIRSGQVQLVVNTPRGRGPRADGAHIRGAARQYKVPLLTTVAAARAAAAGVLERR